MIVGLVTPNEGKIYLMTKTLPLCPCTKEHSWELYLVKKFLVFRKLSVEDNILAILEMTKLSKKSKSQVGKLIR